MKSSNQITDISDHYITRIIPIKLEAFLRATYPEMKKAGLRDKFREEKDNCIKAIIEFHDFAMESPRAAEMAMEKLRTKELLSERDPDELKLSLIKATKIVRESETLYQDQGHHFAFKMTMLCAESLSIVKEAIAQKIQQEQNPLKSALKPSTSARSTEGKSVSWVERSTNEGHSQV